MTRSFCCFAIFLLLALLTPAQLSAQGPTTGTPSFASFGGGPDVINLANLNTHLSIPVLNKNGRGIPFSYNLGYDSSVWYPAGVSGSQNWQPTTATNWGWTTSMPLGGSINHTLSISSGHVCKGEGGQITYFYVYTYSNWSYWDGFGTPHPFSGSSTYTTASPCSGNGIYTSFTDTAPDGSGYSISVTGYTVNSLTREPALPPSVPASRSTRSPRRMEPSLTQSRARSLSKIATGTK